VIRAEASRRRGQLSRTGHGKEGLQVVPVEVGHDGSLIRRNGGMGRPLMLLARAEDTLELLPVCVFPLIQCAINPIPERECLWDKVTAQS
jgi:hypothetical protein